MKKFCIFLVFIILCNTLIPISVSADREQITSGIWTYIMERDNTITIYKCTSEEQEITVPAEIDGYKVNEVHVQIFNACPNVKKVVLSEGITRVQSTFDGCTTLEEVYLPDSVTYISSRAFTDCINLKNVRLSQNIKDIETFAFQNCSSLTEIEIPNGVTFIHAYAFKNCTALEHISLPETLNQIGRLAFENCTALSECILPSKLRTIESQAFSGCSQLQEITIPSSVTNIAFRAFEETSISAVHMEEGHTPQIDYSVFLSTPFYKDKNNWDYSVPSVKALYVNNILMVVDSRASGYEVKPGTKAIATGAFWSKNYQNIKIPEGITEINGIFGDNSSIENLYLPQSIRSIKGLQAVHFIKNIYYAAYEPQWKNVSIDKYSVPVISNSKMYYGDWSPENDYILLTIGNPVAKVFGKPITNDVAPKLVNGRTMLPIRFVAEALGAKVIWTEDTPDLVRIEKDDVVIHFIIGDTTVYVNDTAFPLDSPAFLENDRTYLPVRFVAEHLYATVNWDNATQTVTIIPYERRQ